MRAFCLVSPDALVASTGCYVLTEVRFPPHIAVRADVLASRWKAKVAEKDVLATKIRAGGPLPGMEARQVQHVQEVPSG